MIEACCDAFLHALEAVRGASPHTVKAYAEDLRHFADFAETQGVTDIHAVDAALLRSFLAHLEAEDFARASRARKTASLRSFFAYLARQRMITRSPAAGLRSVRTEKRLPKFLRSDEIDLLLAAPSSETPLGLRDRALLETLYATGMRAGELVTLGVADVDYDEGVVRVIGKGQKERVTLLGRQAVQALERYLR
jgi:integrase/recombinase XerC